MICLITLTTPVISTIFKCSSFRSVYECNLYNIKLRLTEKLALDESADKKRSLVNLHIIEGNVSKIPQDLFNDLPNLKILTISRTKLGDVDGGFVNATKINKFISLENEVKILRDHGFVGAESLVELIISRSSVDTIEDEAFSGLVLLKILKLDSNKIDHLNPKWFEPLKNLNVLNLSVNRIININQVVFQNNPMLRELRIFQNEITSIDPLNFCYANKVRIVDFNGNNCTEGLKKFFFSSIHLGLNRCFDAFFETDEFLSANKTKHEYYECFMKDYEGHAMQIYNHIFGNFHNEFSLKLKRLYRNQHWLIGGLVYLLFMTIIGIVAAGVFVKVKLMRSNEVVKMSDLEDVQ